MKKIMAIILTLCLLCAAFAALADDAFTTDYYTVKLPEGEWQKVDGQGGVTYFYKDGNVLNGAIMFVIQDIDKETAASIDEQQLPQLYKSMIQALAEYAVDGKVAQEESVIAGHPGVLFSYTQETNGIKIPVIGNSVYINGHLIALCYMHMTMSKDEIREKVLELSNNVVFLDGSTQVSTAAADSTETDSTEEVDELDPSMLENMDNDEIAQFKELLESKLAKLTETEPDMEDEEAFSKWEKQIGTIHDILKAINDRLEGTSK